MALNEKKITSYTDNVKNLSDYPSDDGITAAQLKAIFDGRTDKEVKSAINGIIDELTATTGAAQIGTKDGGSVQTALDGKVSSDAGKGLSSNDFTDTEKAKLAGVETGANRTVVDSTLSAESANPVQNKAVQAALDSKVSAQAGKGLSTNDYTDTEKQKLSGIAEGATKTIVDAALSWTSTNPVQNKVVNAAIDAKANVENPMFSGDAVFNGGTNTTFNPQYKVLLDDNTVKLQFSSSLVPVPDGIIFGNGDLSFSSDGQTYKVYTENNKPPVDAALSATSENPVQNKVVNAAIDGLGVNFGTYTGSGSEYKTITLSRKPNWVFVLQKGCRAAEYNNNQEIYYGGLALQSAPVMAGSEKVLEITSTGFTVYYSGVNTASVQVKANENQQTYTYLWG